MRNNRKVFSGTVVSDKMQKTIVVLVSYYRKDRLYNKRIKQTSKFHVHDENEIAKLGDSVNFTETRPLSKNKKFRLLNIIFRKDNAKEEL